MRGTFSSVCMNETLFKTFIFFVARHLKLVTIIQQGSWGAGQEFCMKMTTFKIHKQDLT